MPPRPLMNTTTVTMVAPRPAERGFCLGGQNQQLEFGFLFLTRALAAVLLLSAFTDGIAEDLGVVRITTDQAPIQMGEKIIARVKQGEELPVCEIKGDWYCVLPSRGWMNAKLLEYRKPAVAKKQVEKPNQARPATPTAARDVRLDLIKAFRRQNLLEAQAILQTHPEIVSALHMNWTFLHRAAKEDDIRMAALLLANKADINAKDGYGGETPLFYATRQSNKKMMEFLLTKGANVNAKNKIGYTCLHIAACGRGKDFVKILLNHGADVNAKEDRGNTPLHETVESAFTDDLEALLSHGADVNAKNNDGKTPLERAVELRREEKAKMMREYSGKK